MVKCADCGFLALYNRFTGALDEAPLEDYRSDGHPPVLADAALASEPYAYLPVQPYKGAPTCFVQRHPLINEVRYTEGAITPEAVKAVIDRERDCSPTDHSPGFTTWVQGFTPKEHREMLDRKWMLELEDRRDQEQRAWQEKQEDKADTRHEEQLRAIKPSTTKRC